MIINLTGKIAVVTGGNRGIGKGITDLLVSLGARVYVLGRSLENEEKGTEPELTASRIA